MTTLISTVRFHGADIVHRLAGSVATACGAPAADCDEHRCDANQPEAAVTCIACQIVSMVRDEESFAGTWTDALEAFEDAEEFCIGNCYPDDEPNVEHVNGCAQAGYIARVRL